MDHLLSILESIPNVVWSGLLASTLTLSGVLLSDWSNTKRLKLQLGHDSAERAKERTATLRRDVYLAFAEELVKANAYLATLPQLDMSKLAVSEGIQGFFSASARLQLAAEENTALLVNSLSANYAQLMIQLMRYLLPVNLAKADIQIANDFYEKAQTEVSRILEEMTKLNESGFGDPQVFKALQSNFEFQQGQSNKFASDKADAWARCNRHQIEFQRFLLSEMKSLSTKHVPVMVEVRRDLGLTGNLASFETQMKLQWAKMDKEFDAMIAALPSGTAQIS